MAWHPWFLLGLAGIALPIWLHRFARQTDQKRPFASLMFLEASTIRRSRRHELRYWLLLAARVLLLMLLALAFAGPLWKSLMPPGAAGATLHVIVVDTSLSMQQAGTWERARERARRADRRREGSRSRHAGGCGSPACACCTSRCSPAMRARCRRSSRA